MGTDAQPELGLDDEFAGAAVEVALEADDVAEAGQARDAAREVEFFVGRLSEVGQA